MSTIDKPKMCLKSDGDNFKLIERAGSILSAHGMKKESRDIHQRATIEGYDFYVVLKLLKEYMDIQMVPKSYRKQNCCEVCKYVFKYCDYGGELDFFCHIDKSDRPPCGSVAMKEYSDNFYKDGRYEKWDKWASSHRVSGNGVCLYFKKM